ncbi:MAG: methyltransferase [Bacillota bacterium]
MPNKDRLVLPEELLLAGAAVKCGLIEALRAGPLPFAEVAQAVQGDGRAVERLIEALIQLGYLEVVNGAAALTPEARRMFFEPESEHYTGFAFMHAYSRLGNWLALPEVIRTGRPPRKERSPEKLRYFMDAMREHARPVADAVAGLCLEGLSPPLRLLDLGGGPLNYAVPFARRGVAVTVQDIPEVVELMASKVPPGLDVKLVARDFHEGVAPGPFEVVFLGNITHIYGPEENRDLFSRVAGVLTPGGRIAILDYVRGISARSAYMGINMLIASASGGVWTAPEYTGWLEQAGFGPPRIKSLEERQVLVARLR